MDELNNILTETKKFLRGVMAHFSLLAVLFILLGLMFLIFPEKSNRIICYVLAAVLCVLGVIRIVSYFTTQAACGEFRLDLVSGLLLSGFGIFIFAKPQVLMSILPVAIGVAVLIDSLLKLQSAVDMLRVGAKGWWLTLCLTAITAVLGVLMIINPFSTANVLLQFIGVSLIVIGLLDICSVFSLSHGVRKVRREVRDAQAIETDFTDVTDKAE